MLKINIQLFEVVQNFKDKFKSVIEFGFIESENTNLQTKLTIELKELIWETSKKLNLKHPKYFFFLELLYNNFIL